MYISAVCNSNDIFKYIRFALEIYCEHFTCGTAHYAHSSHTLHYNMPYVKGENTRRQLYVN